MSKIKLSTPINVVSGLALALAIASGVNAATTNNQTVKNISLVASWSLAAVAATNKVVGTYLEQTAENQMLEATNKLTKDLRDIEDKAYRLENSEKFVRDINNKSEVEIANLKQQILENNQTIDVLNRTLTAKIAEFSQFAKRRDGRVDMLYKATINHVIEVMEERINTGYNTLESAINTKIKNDDFESCRDKLEKFLDVVNVAKNSDEKSLGFLKELATEPIEDNESLLTNVQQAFREQDKLFIKIANLKVKFRNLLNVGTQLHLDELSEERQKHIHNHGVLRQYQQLTTQARQDLEQLEIRAEEQKFQALDGIDAAIIQIEEVRKTNFELNQRLIELSKPQLWRPATRDDYRMGNVIITYFENLGYTFDRFDSDYKGWEGTVWFDAYRSKKRVIVKDLNEHGEYLQQQCKSFNVPEFKYEPDRDKFSCYLQFAPKPKKEKGSELPRGVRPASQFPKIVSKWRRVRVTGGSESGKSPTAENIAVCMLKANPATIDFYDPMYDSVKNYRTIPAVGFTHKDSIKGLQTYSERMNNSPSDKFYLAWFDEIDTTIDENPASVKDVKAVIKQASHKNSGLILTGQNANVSALKGLQRSDMNNLVLVHIGSNYRDGIDNSALSNSEKDLLKKLGDELTEWCAAQNEKAGMEATGSNADPNAYRFALVLEPQKRGYYIILPEFGLYEYADLPLTSCSPSAESKTLSSDNHTEEITSINSSNLGLLLQGKKNTDVKPNCPKPDCASSNVVGNGSKDGKKKYICKDCGHHWSV